METSGGPQPHDARIMVWAPPRSLAATYGIDFSFFSSRYLDVSVPGLTFHALWIGAWMHEVSSCGFPHSEIRGSLIMCISPRLFAAYHVFLRPKVPRHPPRVLIRLTTLLFGHHCVAIHSGFLLAPRCILPKTINTRTSVLRSPVFYVLSLLSMFASGKTLIRTLPFRAWSSVLSDCLSFERLPSGFRSPLNVFLLLCVSCMFPCMSCKIVSYMRFSRCIRLFSL